MRHGWRHRDLHGSAAWRAPILAPPGELCNWGLSISRFNMGLRHSDEHPVQYHNAQTLLCALKRPSGGPPARCPSHAQEKYCAPIAYQSPFVKRPCIILFRIGLSFFKCRLAQLISCSSPLHAGTSMRGIPSPAMPPSPAPALRRSPPPRCAVRLHTPACALCRTLERSRHRTATAAMGLPNRGTGSTGKCTVALMDARRVSDSSGMLPTRVIVPGRSAISITRRPIILFRWVRHDSSQILRTQ
jgi:hypothetical protein